MRRRPSLARLVVASLLALPLGVLLAMPADAQPVPALAEHRWKRRVLVVLAPAAGDTAGHAAHAAQRRLVERGRPLLAERDVLVLDVDADDAGRQRALRRALGAPASGFAVVLVGKDGGVKLRRRRPLDPEVIVATIDAMPMGAAEARRRRGSR